MLFSRLHLGIHVVDGFLELVTFRLCVLGWLRVRCHDVLLDGLEAAYPRPSPRSRGLRWHDDDVSSPPPTQLELQPGDERTGLVERLDQYRGIVVAALADLPWDLAAARLLPATDMTIAGIVKHLAWAEDRWFQGRLLGSTMPDPWRAPGADDPDAAMRLAPGDSVKGIVELYTAACERSRIATAGCRSLDHVAAVPSFGRGPVNLRWILVHMIDETARHAGHLDLLRDAVHGR